MQGEGEEVGIISHLPVMSQSQLFQYLQEDQTTGAEHSQQSAFSHVALLKTSGRTYAVDLPCKHLV